MQKNMRSGTTKKEYSEWLLIALSVYVAENKGLSDY